MAANFKQWSCTLGNLWAHLNYKELSQSAQWATNSTWKLYSSESRCPTAHFPATLETGACCLLALVRRCLVGSILLRMSVVAHPSCSTTAAPRYPGSIRLSCGKGITISLRTQFQSHLIRSEVAASLTSSVASQRPARIPEALADVFATVLPTAVSHGAALEQSPQRW